MQYLLWTSIEDDGEEEDLPWGHEDAFGTLEEATQTLDAFVNYLQLDVQDEGDRYVVILSIEEESDEGQRSSYEVIDERPMRAFKKHRKATRLAKRIHDAYQEFAAKRQEEPKETL